MENETKKQKQKPWHWNKWRKLASVIIYYSNHTKLCIPWMFNAVIFFQQDIVVHIAGVAVVRICSRNSRYLAVPQAHHNTNVTSNVTIIFEMISNGLITLINIRFCLFLIALLGPANSSIFRLISQYS